MSVLVLALARALTGFSIDNTGWPIMTGLDVHARVLQVALGEISGNCM